MSASDVGRSSSTTTYEPSPLDAQKAETLNQLRSLLFPALTPELAGGMTSRTQEGMDSANRKGVEAASRSGMKKGDIGLLEQMATGKGDNNSALKMALQLYGYGAPTNPSSSTKAKASPASIAGAYGALGGSALNAAKTGYDMYSNYANAGYQNFDYGAGITQTGTEQGNQWLINSGAAESPWSLSPEAMSAIDAGVGSAAASEGMALGGVGIEGLASLAAEGLTLADVATMIAMV